jgi:hypothetical protein
MIRPSPHPPTATAVVAWIPAIVATDLMMSGIAVWLDEWEIVVGHSISQKIQRGLQAADFVVVILTRNSVASGWVEKEWQSKIGEEASKCRAIILPVLADDCVIAILLQDKNYADLRNSYEKGIKRLIDAIRVHSSNQCAVGAGARIESGRICFSTTSTPILSEMITGITGGLFERTGEGLRAHLQLLSTFKAIQEMNERLGLDRIALETQDFTVSSDETRPTVFTAQSPFRIPAGAMKTNPFSGQPLPFIGEIKGMTTTVAKAVVKGPNVIGEFS